jgi:hypothetical protein
VHTARGGQGDIDIFVEKPTGGIQHVAQIQQEWTATPEEAMANAELIAMAPRMHTAIVKAMGTLKPEDMYKILKAAIGEA